MLVVIATFCELSVLKIPLAAIGGIFIFPAFEKPVYKVQKV